MTKEQKIRFLAKKRLGLSLKWVAKGYGKGGWGVEIAGKYYQTSYSTFHKKDSDRGWIRYIEEVLRERNPFEDWNALTFYEAGLNLDQHDYESALAEEFYNGDPAEPLRLMDAKTAVRMMLQLTPEQRVNAMIRALGGDPDE